MKAPTLSRPSILVIVGAVLIAGAMIIVASLQGAQIKQQYDIETYTEQPGATRPTGQSLEKQATEQAKDDPKEAAELFNQAKNTYKYEGNDAKASEAQDAEAMLRETIKTDEENQPEDLVVGTSPPRN